MVTTQVREVHTQHCDGLVPNAPAATRSQTPPWVLKVEHASQARLHISIDPSLSDSARPIDRSTDCPHSGGISDQHELRASIPTERDHIGQIRTRHPQRAVVAYVGNGNLGMNPWFVSYLDGKLHCLVDEPIHQRRYTCIAAWPDGAPTVEDMWLALDARGPLTMALMNGNVEDVTRTVDWATSGQPLVRAGRATSLPEISEQFYDVRHLVTPVFLRINGSDIFFPSGALQAGIARKALVGPITVAPEIVINADTRLPLTEGGWLALAGDARALHRAAQCLGEKQELDRHPEAQAKELADAIRHRFDEAVLASGYRWVTSSTAELKLGEVRFVDTQLEMRLLEAIYPHNVFVTWPDGAWGFVVWPGRSGREGITLRNAQRFLIGRLGVQNAVLLDNGGDVRLWYRDRHLVGSVEQRDGIRSVLAVTVPQGSDLHDISIT